MHQPKHIEVAQIRHHSLTVTIRTPEPTTVKNRHELNNLRAKLAELFEVEPTNVNFTYHEPYPS